MTNPFEKSICLNLTLSKLGIKRKVPSGAVEVDADKRWVHVNKDILSSNKLDAINKLDAQIRIYVTSRCLPSPLKSGIYLLPTSLLEEVDIQLNKFVSIRKELIEDFLAEYESAINVARDRLGSLFNLSEYPSIQDVNLSFVMKMRYMTFESVPKVLAEISASIAQKARENAQTDILTATEEIKIMMRAAMLDLTNHMVEKLSPKPDGSKQIFRDSLVGNIKEFLETFNKRNIVDDAELSNLVDKAKEILDGVDASMLRENDSLKEKVQANFEMIKASLDTMLQDNPDRVIDLNDDKA